MPPSIAEPMYASVGTQVPTGDGWTFEPKYDGMRVLAHVSASRVRLVTRNGKDKAPQFPEVVAALREVGRRAKRPLVLDGEIVALDSRGRLGPFQALQGRFHLGDTTLIERRAAEMPAALIAFDLLVDGRSVLVSEPWTERRARLESLLGRGGRGTVRISDSTTDGPRMLAAAQAAGWEGVIAKRTAARYAPGARSRDWLKLKLQYRAEFVIGGFTEPRRTRPSLGAILLGYFDDEGRLRYVGHTGGGFDRAGLAAMRRRLDRLERATSPFAEPPRTNERVHWVRPQVVVEVKFAEWTSDGRLRQPIFLGVRDDKDARDVHLERESLQRWGSGAAGDRERTSRDAATAAEERMPTTAQPPARSRTTKAGSPRAAKRGRRGAAADGVVEQLRRIEEEDGGDGTLELDDGRSLSVTSLGKIYFPDVGVTKGELMRYYAQIAPVLLPIIKDRPLVLKRYPEGIEGVSFFQQNAGAHPPRDVRTESVRTENKGSATRIVGGDLLTLLYTVQIGTVAVHPWQSRLATIDEADYSTIDLDPGDEVPFSRVVELARLVKKELDALGLIAALKTSGSSGLHIAMPLPRRTTYEESTALAERIAQRVVDACPKLATLERRLDKRPGGTTYVDTQQNARGKSMASAYSVRARPSASVSAPLDWRELRSTLRIDAFTVRTMAKRLARVGDLWGAAMARRNPARVVEKALSG